MKISTLAAIDIGSNGVRLLINSIYEEEGFPPVFNKTGLIRMPIRLGKDVFLSGRISNKAAHKMLDSMEIFRKSMDIYGVQEYLAYGTSAMREAENGIELARRIREEAKINLKIIGGGKEAELIFETELGNFVKDDKDYLYVDVGGGSTELTMISGGITGVSKSFPVGTVRLLADKVDEDVFPQMKKWIEENIHPTPVTLIGSGGNINHVFKYSGTRIGSPLMGAYLRKHYRILNEMSYEERLRVFNMKPDRADVVVHALSIFIKVMKWTHAKKIHVPKIGISDGMIRELYQRLNP